MYRVPETSLEIIPMGAGAAFGPSDQAQSSYLVRGGGSSAVLDMGSGTFNRLLGEMDPVDLDVVIISHLHPDHLVDLLALRVYMAHGPGLGYPLEVHGPPGLEARLSALVGGEQWEGITFHCLEEGGGTLLAGDLVLSHTVVPHLPPTHAVRVDHGGRSITYGADCAPNDALPELAEGTDVLLLECSWGTGELVPGVPHLNAAAAGEMARRAGARRLVLMHGYPDVDQDAAVAEAQAIFGGPVEWAREGVPVHA